jgi:hypothetical protein
MQPLKLTLVEPPSLQKQLTILHARSVRDDVIPSGLGDDHLGFQLVKLRPQIFGFQAARDVSHASSDGQRCRGRYLVEVIGDESDHRISVFSC